MRAYRAGERMGGCLESGAVGWLVGLPPALQAFGEFLSAVQPGAALRPRQWRAVWRLMRQVPIATRAITRTVAALARPGSPLSPGG